MTVWPESRPCSFAFLTVLWTKHYVSITETNVKLQSSMETIIMPSLKDLTLMISGKNLTLKFLPRAVSCMHTRSLHRFTCCCFFLMQVKKQNQHWQQMQRYSKTTEKSQNLKISLVAKVSAVHRTLARQNSNTEESGQYDSSSPPPTVPPPTNTLNLMTGSGVGVGLMILQLLYSLPSSAAKVADRTPTSLWGILYWARSAKLSRQVAFGNRVIRWRSRAWTLSSSSSRPALLLPDSFTSRR